MSSNETMEMLLRQVLANEQVMMKQMKKMQTDMSSRDVTMLKLIQASTIGSTREKGKEVKVWFQTAIVIHV
jgi:hypothetical protein